MTVAYIITGICYFVAGTVGTIGLFSRAGVNDAHVSEWEGIRVVVLNYARERMFIITNK